MTAYSPFDRDLKDLEARHLEALRQTAEGWYIEYKREVPNAASIAKSISAFANTYGGWVFYGVEEKSGEDEVAGAFPGVPRSDVDASLQRIRQAIAGHLNPSPHFDVKALWGPCDDIGLLADRAVICIQVPWGPNAPHVHKSGQIYRRVAAGSEPKPENDRFVLDQLFRRADDLREQYRDWVNDDPELSTGEKERPYIRLMLTADLWRDRGAWSYVEVNEVREIMQQTQGIFGGISFDTVYTTNVGFVGRQVRNNNPFDFGLTWSLRGATSISDIVIPLHFYTPDQVSALPDAMDGYEHIDRFAGLLQRSGHASPRVVDLNHLFLVLLCIVEIQRRLLTRAGWTQSYFAKARLLNVWRTIPFLDVAPVLDLFEQHGIPMGLANTVTSPSGSTPESFAEIDPFAQHELEPTKVLLQAVLLFLPIARAYGIPQWIEYGPGETAAMYYEQLIQAGNRATEAQRRRLERARRI
ncbi:ATPase AAA [Aliidongia dinghuensis]|uniref:ATPase AAA n=1 Tax=Aliidongia dinghuensis TaxID=1867774 RepID=A0A8J2Z1Q0_9PROT|nr:ATP-binding protein [Aliidongia dinghuensis]GGF46295.1 ATPase AAA [Aliidongia dinghuensis]